MILSLLAYTEERSPKTQSAAEHGNDRFTERHWDFESACSSEATLPECASPEMAGQLCISTYGWLLAGWSELN